MIGRIIMFVALAIGAVLAVVAMCMLLRDVSRVVRRSIGPRDLIILVVLAGFMTWAAQKVGRVTFPRTDPTVAYLTDRGSFTTNDYVHVDFSRLIVPDSATWYLDRRELSSDDDEDWSTFETGTFANLEVPHDFACENATNFNWMMYTDWTPGPSVVTNGVWHAFWGKDARQRAFLIPLRTAVRLDGETIATPKSREDSDNEQ